MCTRRVPDGRSDLSDDELTGRSSLDGYRLSIHVLLTVIWNPLCLADPSDGLFGRFDLAALCLWLPHSSDTECFLCVMCYVLCSWDGSMTFWGCRSVARGQSHLPMCVMETYNGSGRMIYERSLELLVITCQAFNCFACC